jgi:hypothetical protein
MDVQARPVGELVAQRNLVDEAYTDAALILSQGLEVSPSSLERPAADFMLDKAGAFLYPRLFDLCALVRGLDETDARLVLVHNDVEPQTRAICLWAAARNVPSLHMPHAVYQDVDRDPTPGTDIHDLITASHLASAGPFQSEWYKARGFPGEHIRETGMPSLDAWHRNEWKLTKKRARRQLRIPEEARVVCYCSTWPQNTSAVTLGQSEEWIWAYHAFLVAIKKIVNTWAVVKCHPHGGPKNWEWHVNEARARGVIGRCHVTPDHLPNCLWASDAVVGFGGSGVLLEASFVPGLRLLSTHGYEGEHAVRRTPLDAEGMREALEEALGDEQPDIGGLRARFCGPVDGQATERVASWATELAR